MSEIKTLVYCDLEATGLKSSGRPRISELSLVAVNIEDILGLHSQIERHFPECSNQIESLLPRVMNKLTICLYPMATIRPEVSEITGLDNYNLSGQSTFDRNTGELINNFLVRLPAPLCLIAHIGDLSDFPLLMAELEKVETDLDKQCRNLENTPKKGSPFSDGGLKICKYISLANVSKPLNTKREIEFASTTNSRLNDHK